MRKELLCDSSALISLTDSCLLDVIYLFSEKYGINFIIPPSVEDEMVKRPLSIKMKAYRLSAIRLKEAIKNHVLIKVSADTEKEAKSILNTANNIFFVAGKPIHLIDLGEADMIALSHRLKINTLFMDERTTRMLIEAPFQLKEHLEKELKTTVMVNKDNYTIFEDYSKDMRVVRSVDLIALAYEKGYFQEKFEDDAYEAFSASLYKLKYSGCAISFKSIEDYLERLKNV